MRGEGFNVSPLEAGTKFVVETENSFYEFAVINGNNVKVFGGTMLDGSTRFSQPTDAVVCGSISEDGVLKIDWVGKDMGLLVKISNERMMLTSRIKNATLEAADGSWAYSMEWKSD